MIIHDVIQNSPEWYALRLGKITSSEIGDVLADDGTLKEGRKKGTPSKAISTLENKKVAELLTGEDDETFDGTYWMKRGKELEPEAVAMYELLTGRATTRAGFVTNDAGTAGCSPDRLVGSQRGLEIKCLSGKNHVAMLEEKQIEDEHKPQVQMMMMITGFEEWDVMSYHPKMPPLIIPVKRDNVYIANMEESISILNRNISAKLERIKGMQA